MRLSFYKKMKSYKHAYNVLHDLTGMNAKRNPNIRNLANNVLYACYAYKIMSKYEYC